MKALVKCQFHLMTLFVAVLLTVGTVSSDNQTNLPTENVTQMMKKPTIMILGSPHLAGWGGVKVDDMRTPKRQAELQQFVEQLIRFKPTKIAVEADTRWDAKLQEEYNAYLKDDFQLERHEIHQVGFRLAKQMEHSKIYCVDYFPSRKDDPIFGDDFDSDLTDYRKFAKTHGQEHLLSLPSNEDSIGAKDNLVDESIMDMYLRLNQPEWIHSIHKEFFRYSRIGLGDEYPGANWFGLQWYPRNLKTFVNLTRITESADDRILLIIGAAHTFLIQQFLEESGDYIIESPLKYLKTEDAN
jgi:hypothetical protein